MPCFELYVHILVVKLIKTSLLYDMNVKFITEEVFALDILQKLADLTTAECCSATN